MRDTWGSLDLD